MSNEQKVIKKKVLKNRLPEVLNPHGVQLLCQAVLASGIKDHDEDFLNGQVVKFFIENGFKDTPYSLSHYQLSFIAYKKDRQRNQFSQDKIPLDEFKELINTMPLKKVAEYYGKSPDAIRAFCSRHEIERIKRKF